MTTKSNAKAPIEIRALDDAEIDVVTGGIREGGCFPLPNRFPPNWHPHPPRSARPGGIIWR